MKFVKVVAGACLVSIAALCPSIPAQLDDVQPPEEGLPSLWMGPIDGFTTADHRVTTVDVFADAGEGLIYVEKPEFRAMALPFGSVVSFHVNGIDESQYVQWDGAGQQAKLKVPCFEIGPMEIGCTVQPEGIRLSCQAQVVAVTPDTLMIRSRPAVAHPFELNGDLAGEAAVAVHFDWSSVASLRTIEGQLVTSINTPLEMNLGPHLTDETGELDLSSLIEWRADGKVHGLGALALQEPGVHHVEAGPPGFGKRFELVTYEVEISDNTQIIDGAPVTFTASTNPPGYERAVTWFASSKFGTVSPSIGTGATFTAVFENSFGPFEPFGKWSWIGIRSDNAAAGQDEKMFETELLECAAPEALGDLYCLYTVKNVQGGDCEGLDDGDAQGTLCVLCDADFPNGDCPNLNGFRWVHSDCNDNTTCTGDITNSGGAACDTCPALDSFQVQAK